MYANEYVDISKQNIREQLCDKRNNATFSMVDVRDGSAVNIKNTTVQLCKTVRVKRTGLPFFSEPLMFLKSQTMKQRRYVLITTVGSKDVSLKSSSSLTEFYKTTNMCSADGELDGTTLASK